MMWMVIVSEVFQSCYKRTGRVVLVNYVITIDRMYYESGGNKLFTDIEWKKEIPQHLLCNRERERKIYLLCFFPLVLLLQVLHEHQASVRFDLIPFILPVAPQAWRTTAAFSGLFVWHGWPGTCFRSRRKQALRFWSGLLDATTLSFTSSRLSQGSGFSLKTRQETWPWIVAGLLGFNLEMLLIQLANLPLAAFLRGLPLKWIPQPIN